MATILHTIEALQRLRNDASQRNQTIGFVPTMGNLHPGHASLLTRSRQEHPISILSIFVNPTQFNNPADLEHYPRTLQADIQIAEATHTDYIFLPTEPLLYPHGYRYKITETSFSTILEGASRPGHFDGVLTIVMKLLQIIQPDAAYFGEKDYQQYTLIKDLVDDFFLRTSIIMCPTIRETTGLAFSSRNNRLTPERRIFAAHFPRLLQQNNLDDASIAQQLTELGFTVDYITTHENRRYGAVYLDGVRLIDNFSHIKITTQEKNNRLKNSSLLVREESIRINAELSEIENDPEN